MFYEAFCSLKNHFRHPLMMVGELIKSRIDDLHVLSLHRFLKICHFLRSLIDEQHDQLNLFIILADALGHLF